MNDCSIAQNNTYSYQEIDNPSLHKQVTPVKDTTLKIIKNLDGWCSDLKAGILMDFIFMKKPSVVVEIGVFGGRSLIPMALALKYNQKGKIYGIDPWRTQDSVAFQEGEHLNWWGKIDHEQIYQKFLNNLKRFKLEDYVVVVRKTSMDTDIDEMIDMIHIDGNHSEENSLEDVLKWVPKVKRGGIIIFDDVNLDSTNRAVQWLDENCIRFQDFRGDNIWSVWIKA